MNTLLRWCGIAAAAAALTAAAQAGLCDGVPNFADGKTPSRELWVAPAGSDSTGDGTSGKPYATIRFAAGKATPGTAVRVMPGEYAGGGFIYDLAGTTDQPIWIGGAPGGARPVITGGSEGLHFVKARGLVLHDLEVKDAANNGINCDDGGEYDNPEASRYLVFSNLFIHDIGGSGNQDALKLSGLNDFWVIGCEMARAGGAGSGSGIDLVGCHRGVIAKCHMHDLSANAVQAKGGTEDVEVRWCRMVECGQRAVNMGGSTGFEFFRPPLRVDRPNYEARDIRVVANEIVGTIASVAFVGCVDSLAADNTIITPHNWIIRILQETTSANGYEFLPCGNNRFENNLVYFDRSDLSTYVNIGPDTAPETFAFSNNLWYAYDDPSKSKPSLPVAETGGIYGVDPKLKDPAAADYSIGPDSPAAGAGKDPAAAPGDIRGRCYGTPPSIGAHEGRFCRPDCTGDGALNINDFICFQSEWRRKAAYGDYNGDGVWNVNDFIAFQADWRAGC